ncbi:Solute carrier 2 (Facilitated glucose transporter) member 8 [Puccinia graminis f. sp. tritici]|uniref:Solute carrier 2 (Facilitated glucose transporter) member 8 n=1 Tax=Puccinia graminis f. sp. tritici TaxID=56615 RepID=A0A5B0NK07_PUCGR|nr:Solute carrier 2 (Facilitated glucose transporter) member 8 [Puccinia graminis f. sp. tritici]KAA1101209.1 Solute carrier 2 (Facilitated glucose transporter) member 8 [Puccinia graminis f. sp. tritici]KAA1134055.1 Solute carrier 2 (Facilitated glucose transporter) member 8 [Puccinia graminis f. sp. tritici]
MPAVMAGPVTFAPPEGKSSKMAIIIAGFAAFGGFLYGYDTGYIAGVKAMPFWLRSAGQLGPDGKYMITTGQDSLVTSILSVGTFVGALLAYPIGDRFGRRIGIMIACAIFSVGVALQTASTTIPLFVVGRVFAGLGVGVASCLVPMYQSECAPKWIRGGVVACYQWAITIGLLVASVTVNATKDFNSANSYRIPIGIQFVWAAILVIGLAILPESPRYLLLKGREDEAWKSLSRLYSAPYDDPDVQAEFSEIMANLEKERSFGKTTLLDCFKTDKRKNLQRTLTGLGVQGWQQASGINFFFYYGTTFFKNSGIENAFLVTVLTNVVNVVATIPGIWAVDKVGRRTMLIAGAAMMFTCELIVACVGTFTTADNQASQKVLVAFSCIFIGIFAATWGPVPWVVTSEIYPLATRGKQMAMSTASNWVVNFFIGFITPYLVDAGPGQAGLGVKVFWLWAALCFAALTFSFFLIPETKGLSLEQVDLLYTNSTVLKSNSYRTQLIANNLHEGMTPAEKAYQEKLEHI